MALILMEGFDHYNTSAHQQLKGWNVVGLSSYVTGRFAGQAFSTPNSNKLFTTSGTIIAGFAVRLGVVNAAFVSFFNVSTLHVDLRTDINGNLYATRNGTTIGSVSSTLLLTGVWYYIELKITISDTVGVVVVKVDGITALNLSGVDTQNGITTTMTAIALGTLSTSTHAYDDMYILNTTGSAPNNDFIGEKRITTIFPNGAGSSTQFTPSAGSNYQNVDDTTSIDSDTTYNSSSTPGHIDLYAFENTITGTSTINGIQTNLTVRKDDAGTRTVRPKIRHSSTNYDGTSANLSASYTMLSEKFETNPGTGVAWTTSDVDNAEFGVELVA